MAPLQNQSDNRRQLADAILALELRRRQAIISQDRQTLEDLLAEDMSFVHTNGECDSRKGFIADIGNRVEFLSFVPEQENVTLYGDTAILVAQVAIEAVIVATREPLSMHTRTTSVWQHLEGRWQLVAYQATRCGA